jgi:thioredoxin-like negative regulator of GroEL
MASMVHGLEVEYWGRVKFSYLDADDPRTQVFQRELGFRYQPEFYLLDGDGNVLRKLIGFTSETQFRELFDEYVQ